MIQRVRRWAAAIVALAACAGSLTACTSAAAPTATSGAGPLAGVCPATVVIQTDWEPEAEHGPLYNLLGDDYTIDTEKKAVSGPLLDGSTETGVDVEIRIGGSPVGYQSAQALLYGDKDILLAYGRVTEYLAAQADLPVTAVMSGLEKSPYAIYWDPQTYPDVHTIGDLAEHDVTVLAGATEDVWMSYLTGEGILDASQLDRSDAPRPATFVAAKGKVAEAGYITAEPYTYEHEVPEWGRPLTGQLIHDTGYPEYFQALIVREDDVAARAACLERLVPVLQRAQIAYAKDPARANALIVSLVDAYDTGWVYSAGAAAYSHDQQVARGLLADGADGVMGSFETARVQRLIDIVARYHSADVARYGPDDLVTNRFLDTSLHLG
ncbi:ABC transporter substrate-binding protein [Propionicicella superfundia]|uniref:ABC transporter substrate-binding protein n=1 Tax=Propionicicella superfundia TaxID=348582 RepID=UPI000424714A|nr:ABC transporter substrate-binding protein [Propionicicella superfundia]